MPYAHNGQEQLYFETQGDGPPLVLIRGLSRSLRFWTEELLAPLRERYRLVLFDHRGIGRSSLVNGRFTIADMAHDLAAVMDAADASRAHVFGISLGGLVAQELALLHPERIDKLALGATFAAHRPHGPRYQMFVPLIVGSALRSAYGQWVQMRVLTTERFAKDRREMASQWHALLTEEPMNKRVVIAQMLAALSHNAKARVCDIRSPTLVLTGDGDRLISMKCSEVLAGLIPGATLCVLPGAGHDFPAQLPEESAAALLSFFDSDG